MRKIVKEYLKSFNFLEIFFLKNATYTAGYGLYRSKVEIGCIVILIWGIHITEITRTTMSISSATKTIIWNLFTSFNVNKSLNMT